MNINCNKKISTQSYDIKSWKDKFPDYNVKLQNLPIDPSWKPFFNNNIIKQELESINEYLSACLNQSNGNVEIFPYPDLVFNALNITPLSKIKVVILGQDPYFNKENKIPQAMGLSFSVPSGIHIPPSLDNIYKNLKKFDDNYQIPTHGDLSSWAEQGVLLFNTSLTVEEKSPNSHTKKWTKFSDLLIQYISDNCTNVVFALFGAPSLDKLKFIDQKKHSVTISSHPSPLSYSKTLRNYKSFSETDHFNQINKFLKEKNNETIKWKLD